MQKKPQQPATCDGNNSRAHLRLEHLRGLVAAHPRKSECGASPKDAGQYMQHLGDNEGGLHDGNLVLRGLTIWIYMMYI